MEIRQFRVVVKARDFERTCRFYGETLALPRLQSWDREGGRGALFQAGAGAVEVLGRAHGNDAPGYDETFDYQGPSQKMVIELIVPSAEKMPAEHYGFKPAPGVRSYAELVSHVADGNYLTCAPAKGAPNPQKDIQHTEKTAKTKDEVVKALKVKQALSDMLDQMQ